MPDSKNVVINPSTYKQVVENAKKILELLDSAGDITNITEDITNIKGDITDINKILEQLKGLIINPPATGDIINTDDGLKVIGVHINTSKKDENTPITDYQQGITFEFKNTTVIGVNSLPGMSSGPYCAVMTVKQDSSITGESGPITTTPFQIAYSVDEFYFYRRNVTDGNAWGEWLQQQLGGGGGSGGDYRQQIIQSETEPVGQEVGDYWAEPIASSGD